MLASRDLGRLPRTCGRSRSSVVGPGRGLHDGAAGDWASRMQRRPGVDFGSAPSAPKSVRARMKDARPPSEATAGDLLPSTTVVRSSPTPLIVRDPHRLRGRGAEPGEPSNPGGAEPISTAIAILRVLRRLLPMSSYQTAPRPIRTARHLRCFDLARSVSAPVDTDLDRGMVPCAFDRYRPPRRSAD